MSDFYSSKLIKKSRKEHKCWLCDKTIDVGLPYLKIASVWQGDFSSYNLHEHCDKMIARYCSENREYEYDGWAIQDWLSDNYCYGCSNRDDCQSSVFECENILKDFKEGDKQYE